MRERERERCCHIQYSLFFFKFDLYFLFFPLLENDILIELPSVLDLSFGKFVAGNSLETFAFHVPAVEPRREATKLTSRMRDFLGCSATAGFV